MECGALTHLEPSGRHILDEPDVIERRGAPSGHAVIPDQVVRRVEAGERIEMERTALEAQPENPVGETGRLSPPRARRG